MLHFGVVLGPTHCVGTKRIYRARDTLLVSHCILFYFNFNNEIFIQEISTMENQEGNRADNFNNYI